MKKKIKFVGLDSWDREVYKTETGVYLVDVSLCGAMYLYTKCNNEFDGEPDSPVRKDIEFVVVK